MRIPNLLFWLFLPSVAVAQSTTFLRVALGPQQAAVRNPAATDYGYAGWGTAFRLGVGRERPRSSLDFTTRFDFGGLRSDVTGASANDWVFGMGTRYLRALGSGRAGLMIGADVSATAHLTQYTFNSRLSTTDEFGYFLLGFSPALRVSRALRSGRLTNDFSFVALGFIDSPYANAKMNGSSLKLRAMGPTSLRGFEDAVTYCVACDRGRSVAWTYRLSFLSYSIDDTRQFARHSLSMTAAFPVRRR